MLYPELSLNNKSQILFLLKTAAPQETVLSPFLFTLDTADRTHSQVSRQRKVSHDSALVDFVENGDDQTYRNEII